MEIKDILPSNIYAEIKEHLQNNGNSAQKSWNANEYSEDALTGALGERLSRDSNSVRKDSSLHPWIWSISYKKFSSKKLEPKLGADGLFEIVIKNNDTGKIYQKGIIFQAKKHNNLHQSDLKEQVEKMEKVVPGGTSVFDYGAKKYGAIEGKSILNKQPEEIGNIRREAEKLGDFFVDKFLVCHVGINGMHFDAFNERLFVPQPNTQAIIYSFKIKHRIKIQVIKQNPKSK